MKKKSKITSTIINTIVNFIYQIINILVNLIVPPLLINKFGSTINGLVSSIKQVVNYVQLVGAGISESTVVSLYKPINNNDEKKISAIYNACSYAFNKSGIFFSFLSIIVSFIYPLFILKENLNYFTVVFLVLALCISGASEFFVVGKYRALLTADQKLYVINIAQIIGSIMSTVTIMLTIKLNLNIVIVELIASFTYILRIFILTIYVNRKYKFLDDSIKRDMNAISRRKDATIHQLASLIMFGSQTLFITKFCGLAEASVYAVYNLIFTGLNTVLSTISSAMLPGVGSIMASNQKDKLDIVYNIYELIFFILTFTFFSVTFIMIPSFINIYIGAVADINYIRNDLIILFIISGILNCIRTPAATLINGGGYYKETKNRAIIEMVICIVMQFLLVHKLQVSGILIGTIMAYLYRTIDVLIYSHKKILLKSVLDSFKRIIGNTILMIMIIFFTKYNLIINVNNYISWGIFSTITFIICFMIYFVFNYFTNIKMIQYLKKVMSFRKGD